MGTADFAKLAASRSEIDWSDADILGMLVKRIANISAPLADYCRRARNPFDRDETPGLLPKPPTRRLELVRHSAGGDDGYRLLAPIVSGSGRCRSISSSRYPKPGPATVDRSSRPRALRYSPGCTAASGAEASG